ncbi:MAG TPA: TlpA disulfide reductase family protein [Bryobacteraceae bacterium]|nr:TlpA disulfide reductase family protein [Bryobacteraceae bacterium]HOQ44409.1 TlpA disulfide reductase family protein [Bryobacteraceae bacterium]HPQ16165.1 TlpA disulfide reductase family protein [Bryobacteraceae bacterium]HPU70728.1 TlpA disulfide reductase family protein [Bryobacteraceae bacterium]
MTRRLFAHAIGFGLVSPALFAAQVPRPAPELVIRQVNGKQLLLSQFRGKVVAVEFLQTTCPHCQTCSALLNKMYQEYGPRGFQPIGIAFNDMATMLVPDYVKQLGLKFPIGVGTRDEVVGFLQHPVMEIMYVPQLVFIDRKGVIRAQHAGGSDFFKNEEANMRKQIEALLNESTSSTPKKRSQAAK